MQPPVRDRSRAWLDRLNLLDYVLGMAHRAAVEQYLTADQYHVLCVLPVVELWQTCEGFENSRRRFPAATASAILAALLFAVVTGAVRGLWWLRGQSPIVALREEKEAPAKLGDSEVARAQKMLFDGIALLLNASEHGLDKALPSDFLHARDIFDDHETRFYLTCKVDYRGVQIILLIICFAPTGGAVALAGGACNDGCCLAR